MGSSVILPAPGQPKVGPDPLFAGGSIPNIVSFLFNQVAPPSNVYLQRDDVVLVSGVSSAAGESITVQGRLLLPYAVAAGQPDQGRGPGEAGAPIIGPGIIVPFQNTFALGTGLNSAKLVIAQTEGYLLSMSVFANQATQRGQTFVRAWLNRGAQNIISPNAYYLLFADYCTTIGAVGYPIGRVINPVEGPGFIQQYAPSNPAAGADFSVSSSPTGRIRLQTLLAKLVTSATAGNRVVGFTMAMSSPAGVAFRIQDTNPIAASTTVFYNLVQGSNLVRGGGAIGTEVDIVLPAPTPWVGRTSITLASVTQGLLAGDQWSNIILETEEWMEGF
jgi:hypothetical protein